MIDLETKKILEKNQQLLEDLEIRVKKIQKKMMWGTIGGVLKIIFILGPIVFGVIYLSPYVNGYFKAFKPMFETLQLLPYQAMVEDKDLGNDSQASQQIIDSFCDPEVRDVMINQYCPKE
ncbi:hypothetical protein C4566_01135 [Candidatus Parcubacteria bacterium]|nr:MAG: hypothetical protein C4566_01135 [Candidatus Parcubacteria bacterium]